MLAKLLSRLQRIEHAASALPTEDGMPVAEREARQRWVALLEIARSEGCERGGMTDSELYARALERGSRDARAMHSGIRRAGSPTPIPWSTLTLCDVVG